MNLLMKEKAFSYIIFEWKNVQTQKNVFFFHSSIFRPSIVIWGHRGQTVLIMNTILWLALMYIGDFFFLGKHKHKKKGLEKKQSFCWTTNEKITTAAEILKRKPHSGREMFFKRSHSVPEVHVPISSIHSSILGLWYYTESAVVTCTESYLSWFHLKMLCLQLNIFKVFILHPPFPKK